MPVSKLYVGNLNYSTTNEQLQELFAKFGTVEEVTIIGTKGFGFVQMSDPAEAENAQKALNGTKFMGRTLKVDDAHPIKNKRFEQG